MQKPKIKIVCRYKGLTPIAQKIKREALARGIVVSDKDYDLIVAVGGDGTLISAAVEGKPIMAVKGGSKNHMIDILPDKIGKAFDMLLLGKFKEERYVMLEVATKKKKVLGFNEIGIKSVVPLPIGFSVSYLGSRLEASGDGVIVSTPQGSMGWSFSSNGTYLSDKSNAFIISLLDPILSPLRSIVIPQVPVRLKVSTKDHRGRAVLVADGNIISTLEDGDEVLVSKSKKEAIIYRFFENDSMKSALGRARN